MKSFKNTRNLAQSEYNYSIPFLNILSKKDNSLSEHSIKTSYYVQLITEELIKKGLYKEEINEKFVFNISMASLIHDIGKIYTPDEILNKPSKLTAEEFAIMKLHTINGNALLNNIIARITENSSILEALTFSKDIVLFHHERWDGKGYPYGLSSMQIPLSARITAVADTFDAITSNRVYKKASSSDEALKIIENESSKQFDPLVVAAFISAFDKIMVAYKKNLKHSNR